MEQPTRNAGMQSSSPASSSESPAARPGLEHSSGATSESPLLGPRGETIRSAEEFNSGFGRIVGRNPVLASVASLTVGLIVGMIVGAAVARE